MKESTKMEDYDGSTWNFIAEHKTKNLPLRWFANLCEKPASYHLGNYLHYADHDDFGLACRFHAYLSTWWYKPYLKWGTVYKLDKDKVKDAWDKDNRK